MPPIIMIINSVQRKVNCPSTGNFLVTKEKLGFDMKRDTKKRRGMLGEKIRGYDSKRGEF